MNFLNQPLAWGAIAFTIPLILHILNRSRFRRVEWGAMHLLESVVKVNHKRFRLEQLLLLLVRCAIPALLAFALAKPVLTGSQAPAGDAPVSMVILLDTSYSMDAISNGVSPFDKAVAAACDIVEATPRGSEISVIQTGGTPTPLFDQPAIDSTAILRRLRMLRGGYGASDMQQSLDAGIATLAGMTHARRELIVISDFQPSDWNGSNAAESIQQQIEGLSIKPEVTLLPTGVQVSGNVSVDSLSFSNRPLGVGHQLAVRANLRNHGNTPFENARVILKIDGAEESVTQVQLGASAETQTLFPCEFKTAGSHVVEVELRVDDPLAADNRQAAAVTVWEQIDVLLVDGDPSSQALEGETDFLSVALTPYTFGRMKLADLVQTQTVTSIGKLKADLLDNTKVVVLANVPRLTDAQIKTLHAFVSNGGGLLVFSGNRVDTKWYNEKLFTGGLLPAEFGLPKGKIDDKGVAARVVVQHFDHPALQFFNEASNGDLSAAEIRQWHELKLPENDEMIFTSVKQDEDRQVRPESGAIVLARLDSGDPLMVEHSIGDGVVVQVATACDADWSDMPMKPFYVPLMQQLVTTMATQASPPRNIQAGESAVAVFRADNSTSGVAKSKSAEGAGDEAGTEDTVLSVVTPEGSRRTLKTVSQGNSLIARFDATQRPGTYTMTTPEAESIHFVATTARGESDLSILNDSGMKNLADQTGAGTVESATEYLEQDRLRRNGREIWRYMLAALLAFMFLELVLQQRFSKVRS